MADSGKDVGEDVITNLLEAGRIQRESGPARAWPVFEAFQEIWCGTLRGRRRTRLCDKVPAVRHLLISSVVVFLCCVVSSAVFAADEPRGIEALDGLRGGAKVDALVDLVVERQRALISLKSAFVQDKSSELLLEPVTSRGLFRFKAPDRARWDYEAPDEMIVLFVGETLTTFRPDDGVAERITVPKKHSRFVRVLAGTQPLDELKVQFSMTLSDRGAPKPFVLTLKPIHRTLKRKLAQVRLEIDRNLLLPVVVEYLEADGDSTRYEFTDLKANTEIPDEIFELVLGDDVRVNDINLPD